MIVNPDLVCTLTKSPILTEAGTKPYRAIFAHFVGGERLEVDRVYYPKRIFSKYRSASGHPIPALRPEPGEDTLEWQLYDKAFEIAEGTLEVVFRHLARSLGLKEFL